MNGLRIETRRFVAATVAALALLASCVGSPAETGPVDPASLSEGQRLAAVMKDLELGRRAMAEERIGIALDAFDRALALDPESADAWLGKATAYGHWTVMLRELAVASYRKAIELEPTDPSYRIALAEYLIGENLLEDVEQALEGAERLVPRDPYLAILYVKYWTGRRVLDEAQRWAVKAIEVDARNGWAYFLRAEVYFMMDDAESAKADFGRARDAFAKSGDEGGVANVEERLAELGW